MFIILLLLAAAAEAQTVRLSAYPQKIRTSYGAQDTRVPEATAQKVETGDGARWEVTPGGVWRRDPRAAAPDRVQYFAGKRYLPDGPVTGIATDGGRGIWVRSASGATHIEMKPMKLSEKAELFEQRIEARHVRHGFTADSHLREPGNLATSVTASNDNDGLWTAMYGAGELFRYSVTKSDEALRKARRAIDAILFLEEVTGRPGFPARSYVDATEQRPQDGFWYPAAGRKLQWKADTSSDEIVGHMLIFALGHDLLPPNDPLKPRIAATCRRIMDHIVANGYHLIDVTGKPTRWGRWSPEYFATPTGRPDSPLNAIELLSFLKTTHHITGDGKYDREYRKVALEMKYAEIGTRYLELMEELNYSDEELAMLSFYPLFLYERDPRLLDYYRRAVDQWWKNCRRELNPLWTFIYKVGRPEAQVDMAGAAWTLYRIPMDLVSWTVDNSARADLTKEGAVDRFERAQSAMLIPPDERPVMKWNSNPFRLLGGNGGRSEDDGAFFILPYWMGRHHRFLTGE